MVSGGVLTLTAEGYREYEAPASWINTVNAATGYTIEFRLRIAPESDRPSELGIWYNDNTYLTVINIDHDHIYMRYPINGAFPAGLDATLWHTYRIVVMGSQPGGAGPGSSITLLTWRWTRAERSTLLTATTTAYKSLGPLPRQSRPQAGVA